LFKTKLRLNTSFKKMHKSNTACTICRIHVPGYTVDLAVNAQKESVHVLKVNMSNAGLYIIFQASKKIEE